MNNQYFTGLSTYNLICSGWNPTNSFGYPSAMAIMETRNKRRQDFDKKRSMVSKHKEERNDNAIVIRKESHNLMSLR